MSGETTIAKEAVNQALAAIKGDASKSDDALLLAVLGQAVTQLLQHRSRADIMSYLEYMLENAEETDWVITRGC